MTVPLILCRSQEYHSAGEAFGQCATDAGAVHTGLVQVLTANAGMAGSDSTGADWAKPYDEAADLAVSTSAQLVTAFGQIRELVVSNAYNHELAEAKANHKPVPPPPAPPPTPPPNLVQDVPSAAGHGIPEPFGWSIIRDIVGALWPNGDQDQLRTAQTAWNAAAADFHTIAGNALPGITLLQNQKSAEIETAVQTVKARQTDLNDLGDACKSLGDACGEYANHLDEAHKKIIEELAEFGAEIVVGEVIFAVLAPFTAGISEAVGNSAVAARIAMKARRVATIIGELASKVAGLVGRALRPLLEKLKPLLEKVRQWVEAAKSKLSKTKEPEGKEPESWPGAKTEVNAEAAKTAESVEKKLNDYLLNPDHPVGGPKAKWFEQALGFNRGNANELGSQIVFNPTNAIETGVTQYDTKYNQVISIVGANGKTIDVTFAWIRNNDGIVRLVTAIPTKR